MIEMPGGKWRRARDDERDKNLGRLFRIDNLTSQTTRVGQTTVFPVEIGDRKIRPATGGWKTNKEGMARLIAAGRVRVRKNSLGYVRYVDDFAAVALNAFWADTVIAGRPGDKVYVVQTSPKVVERCLLMTTDPGDLVLDPTCGAGTTAFVAEQWGRRWITVDTSRVALALARTRLMSAKYPYYLLADSPEGVAKEAEVTQRIPPQHRTDNDIRKGFVYKRVPHVTLKSIANNPDIRDGMTRDEIDAAIARHADTELLYDKPYEDGKRIRVTGPFTVESLSPHRVLAVDEERPAAEIEGQRSSPPAQFETMIVDNLRKAGIQNTKKAERLAFEALEIHAGEWIHAAGTYTDSAGELHRVAVSIGPEHGTVGPTQVKEAAKEAVQRRRLRYPCRLRVRLRSACQRGGEALWQSDRAAGTHESGPVDGRRAPEEDGGRQPVHGLRRAGPRRAEDGGWKGRRRDPRARRVRPHDGRNPVLQHR